MKKVISIVLLLAMVLTLAACGDSGKKKDEVGTEKLVSEYGFQWTDPNAPILNEKGAKEITFTIYSSKNASALDYNDMKIMQDLFKSTNVNVFWENVSESVYSQQKNLIFGNNADERPLNFVYNNWQGNQCDLYGMFGLNDNLEHRVIVDGKVTYTVQDERFKEATNFIANWVKNGLIDPVSFEQSQDNFLANGKGLETYGAFYWWESETVVSNPENYILCNPLIGPNGDQTVCVSNNPEVGTGEVVVFSDCANVEVLLAYFDRYYAPEISAQINYGPIGIVYEEEKDANGMLVQKPIPEGMTTDELRLQNAPLGIIYLSDYAWKNVVNMEPRAKLRLERLDLVAKPFVPENVKPCPNLQFTLDELNTLSNYETNLNDYIRTNLINWLLKGGVTDAQWQAFQADLDGKIQLAEIQKVYQDAYDRFVSKN